MVEGPQALRPKVVSLDMSLLLYFNIFRRDSIYFLVYNVELRCNRFNKKVLIAVYCWGCL